MGKGGTRTTTRCGRRTVSRIWLHSSLDLSHFDFFGQPAFSTIPPIQSSPAHYCRRQRPSNTDTPKHIHNCIPHPAASLSQLTPKRSVSFLSQPPLSLHHYQQPPVPAKEASLSPHATATMLHSSHSLCLYTARAHQHRSHSPRFASKICKEAARPSSLRRAPFYPAPLARRRRKGCPSTASHHRLEPMVSGNRPPERLPSLRLTLAPL